MTDEIPAPKELVCDVDGCDDPSVARLHINETPSDRGERCRDCLLFDLIND